MRFSVPRSLSPSPVRRPCRDSTYGLKSDAEDSNNGSESNHDSTDTDSSEDSSSTGSYSSKSGSRIPPRASRVKRSRLSPAEQQCVEETVSAIRLRARYYDPYEEWEEETRKDAFRTARRQQSLLHHDLREQHGRLRLSETQRLNELHARQLREVQNRLKELSLHQQDTERRMRDRWKDSDTRLWQRVEDGIKLDEDKVKARLDAARKAREEAERKQRELERKQQEEQRRKTEALKKVEEEKRMKEAAEAQRLKDEQRKKEEEKKKREEEQDMTNKLMDQRKNMGLTVALDDWRQARQTLQELKTGPMKQVKSNKAQKSVWSTMRREITPKIGQLTNDEKSINLITSQLREILSPPNPHPLPIYLAALSSLSKAILLQAEAEVTAEKRSAVPLARVTQQLLDSLPKFADVFFAKLIQRTGTWAIPMSVPSSDYDGQPWKGEDDRVKAMGYRKSGENDGLETTAEYCIRVAGIMRLYFHVLVLPPAQRPLPPMYRPTRYWTWFARIVSERGLLESPTAPHIIYAALDVYGSEAKGVWGSQWIKLLGLLYEGLTAGLGDSKFIGGNTAEGKSARVRVQLEIEKIMRNV